FAPRRFQWWAAPIALVTLAATTVATIGLMGSLHGVQRFTFSDTYALDGAALWGKLIIIGTTAVVVALSVDWFAEDPRHGEYYAILLLSALGAILLAGASDLMELTLAVLLSSATGSVLIAYHRRSKRSGEAAIKYYLLGALSNGVMAYGVVLLFGLAATTTYSGLLAGLSSAHPLPLIVGGGLVIVGLAFKMGAVPVHAWMPDVADGAPAPIAAFVTAAPKIGALIALARLMLILPESGIGWRPVIALLAALTMSLGNAAALWQDNVRRLLGWSAVSQTGYGLMAVVAIGRSPLALPALLYFLVAYTLGNLAAFGVVIQLRGESDRSRYAGLARSHPLLAAALVVSFLSFVGIPPLAGFAAKLALFGATIEAGYSWLAVVAVINTVVSLAYYARILGPVYFGVLGEKDPVEALPILGNWAVTAALLSAATLVVLGIGAESLLSAFHAVRFLPG
ncbi:MAG: NADH-quinone oxidoreductase subunit N, partial [Gemmatimonadota bacterium]|nr:NADH-quinone oxidoreductase subunit N [Gemmatimonadota bacterium]